MNLESKDYQTAIDIQNACNLSGVINSFYHIMKKISQDAIEQGHGTDWKNNHPICKLFAEQIYHLSNGIDYSKAFDECEKMAQ